MIIPDKPYMIVLGTSHVNGDCMQNGKKDAEVNRTAYEQIAAHFGLELLNVGLSGCTNYDLLQATMELNHNGFTDWYLPTIGELELLYENLSRLSCLDFDKGIY